MSPLIIFFLPFILPHVNEWRCIITRRTVQVEIQAHNLCRLCPQCRFSDWNFLWFHDMKHVFSGDNKIFMNFLVNPLMKRKAPFLPKIYRVEQNLATTAISSRAYLVAQLWKNLPANAGNTRDVGSIPGLGRSPEDGNENLFQYSCLEIPWTEEPAGLQSMWSQRVRHD